MKRTHRGAGLDAGSNFSLAKKPAVGIAVTPESRGELLQVVLDVLRQFQELGEDAVEGSRIAKSLLNEPSVAELALSVKAALGGKGWMRRLVAGCADIEYIDVQDREPCFRLSSMSSEPLVLRSLEKEAEEFSMPEEICEEAAAVINRCIELLTEAAEAGEGFVTGSVLRTNLGPEFGTIAHTISEAFGKQKGWLKKLLLTEPTIEQVQDTGKGEPCFRLVGSKPARGGVRLQRPLKPSSANKSKDAGKGKGKAPMFMEKGKGKMPMFMEKGKGKMPMFMEKGKGKMPMFMDAKGKGWMGKGGPSMKGMHDPYSDPHFSPYGGMDPYSMPGAAKGQGKMFGAYGGPAKGFQQEVPKGCKGKGKSKGDSKTKAVKQERNHGELANCDKKDKHMVMELPEQFAHEGERVSEVLHNALLAMQDENGGYVEGNKLSKIATQEDPDATAVIKKAFMGKGWLKKLLSADPNVELVTVPGKDEPCFRLQL